LTKAEIKKLQERVDRIKVLPSSEPFSSRSFAQSARRELERLSKDGDAWLTDPYGKNYRRDLLMALTKAADTNYVDGVKYIESLTADERMAIARLLREIDASRSTVL
jgi:hypothetical protein